MPRSAGRGSASLVLALTSVSPFDAQLRARGARTWFLGAITDEQARTLDVPLDFLDPGRRYQAEIYADGPKAHWLTNPLPVTISRRAVSSATRLRVVLAPGGGQAIRIRPLP